MKPCRSSALRLFVFLLPAVFFGSVSSGQWISETFALSNGWNAIYLRGTPWPTTIDDLFTNLPIRAVHRNFLTPDTTQFSASSGDTPQRGVEWLVWYPPESPNRVLTSLWNMSGNASYLIECDSNCTWTLKGNPVVPYRVWLPNNWNLVGMPVNPASGVTFTEFFQAARNIDVSPSPAGGKVARTLPNGSQQDISSQTDRRAIGPKEAYWIKTQGLSAFIGTVLVQADPLGLLFPADVSINSFTLWNDSGTNETVTVKLISSEAPPAGAPALVDDVPLMYFGISPSTGHYEWQTLAVGGTLQNSLATGEQWIVTLAVNRSLLSPPPTTNSNWQSLLEVTDQAGTLIRIPVAAEYSSADAYNALWPAGLWVGDVALKKVNQLAEGNTTGPMPTYGDLTLRLIMHIGTNGQARLLQQTVLVWTEQVANGTTNGFYRLRANEKGVAANARASRISSVAFPYGLNCLMTGSLQDSLNATYVIGYNDPVNPFKHIYNPGHDNLDYSGELLPEGAENYSISNTVSLTMDHPPELGPNASLWNPGEDIEGLYTHTIYGLRREPVRAEGRFKLRRVNRTGVLE
ncbi:MAG: hypothetical protein A2X46_16475 [Lentisphaerae bacterium GWF2_57_35]|nr:MAG: hypothetical protein A2X46_16475 [Lentisphaerae bacterium GWF2_57_35]